MYTGTKISMFRMISISTCITPHNVISREWGTYSLGTSVYINRLFTLRFMWRVALVDTQTSVTRLLSLATVSIGASNDLYWLRSSHERIKENIRHISRDTLSTSKTLVRDKENDQYTISLSL